MQLKKNYHFALINDLSRLLNKQLENSSHKKWLCKRCLNHFKTEQNLIKYFNECKKVNNLLVKLPEEHERIFKFEHHKNKEKVPFIIYADLKC